MDIQDGLALESAEGEERVRQLGGISRAVPEQGKGVGQLTQLADQIRFDLFAQKRAPAQGIPGVRVQQARDQFLMPQIGIVRGNDLEGAGRRERGRNIDLVSQCPRKLERYIGSLFETGHSQED
jgi:hypothetical protein